MRNIVKAKLNIIMAFLFVFNVLSCGGGGSSGDSQEKQLEKELTDFNSAMEKSSDNLVSLMASLDQLNTAIAADDGSTEKTTEIKELADQFATYAESLVESIERMDTSESEIQKFIGTENTLQTKALITTLIGTGLVIHGLYKFATNMKTYSDEMIEARKKRDAALDALDDNETDALDQYEEAQQKMAKTGHDATQEFATKVTTDLVLSPINPTSTTGIILKDMAGNKLQSGLKVISSTKSCEDGYENSGCKIGIDETDESGKAVVPKGDDTTIVVGGHKTARTVVEKDITENEFTEVAIEPVAIEDAGDELLPPDDDDDEDDDDSGDDTSTNTDGDTSTGSAAMSISSTVSSEDSSSITYLVSVAVSGITSSTTVTISVENASTSGSKKTLSEDGTVLWTVIVLDKDASVSVVRSDTGEQVSISLDGKKTAYDGTYIGTAITTWEHEDCWCWDSVDGLTVIVSGTTLSGDVSGTLSGNLVSGVENEYSLSFSGTISGSVMSGTWYDPDGCCSGTFSLTRQ